MAEFMKPTYDNFHELFSTYFHNHNQLNTIRNNIHSHCTCILSLLKLTHIVKIILNNQTIS